MTLNKSYWLPGGLVIVQFKPKARLSIDVGMRSKHRRRKRSMDGRSSILVILRAKGHANSIGEESA
jgi:hypothetical protein